MLKFNKDTIPNLIYKGVMRYKTDWRIIMTALITFITF